MTWAGSLNVGVPSTQQTTLPQNGVPNPLASLQLSPPANVFGAPVPIAKREFSSYFRQQGKPKAFVTLMFGDTSCGKTFTGMSYPEPIYVIDTENRAISTKYYNYGKKDIHIFEPVQFKTTFTEQDSDALDTFKTIEEINHFIIDFANEVRSGKITKGTLIVDSTTDIWSFVQDWAMTELSKKMNAKGEKRADPMLMKMQNQFDWGVPNKKHAEMLGTLRSLIQHGIYIVFTARERETPDYVQATKVITMKDKIRCQKDVPFLADVIINLKKVTGTMQTKYYGQVVKMLGLQPPNEAIENITFEKLQKAIDEQEQKVKT